MRSVDSTEKNTLYFASISNTQRPKSDRQRTCRGQDLPPAFGEGRAASNCPSPASSSASALPLPRNLQVLHFVPIALTLGLFVPWWIRKYTKKRASYPSLPPPYSSSTLPPGSGLDSGEKHNFNRAVIWLEFPSGLRVWSETNTHQSRIKESESVGHPACGTVPTWGGEAGMEVACPRGPWERMPSGNSSNHYSESP